MISELFRELSMKVTGWSKVPVALPVLIPVPVLFSASAASAAKFHTEKALVLE